MRTVRLFNIQWDTDGEDAEVLRLPTEHVAIVEDDFNAEERAADLLSDQYGFCVSGCRFEVLDG